MRELFLVPWGKPKNKKNKKNLLIIFVSKKTCKSHVAAHAGFSFHCEKILFWMWNYSSKRNRTFSFCFINRHSLLQFPVAGGPIGNKYSETFFSPMDQENFHCISFDAGVSCPEKILREE